MSDSSFLFKGLHMETELFSVESLSFAENFLVKDDDVIMVSYPRSGTHWMAEIVSLIVSKGDPTWVQTVEHCVRCPWIETIHGQKLLLTQDGPRLMCSHLPIQLFPKSYFTSKAKIIYIMRNPRDVVTSLYYLKKSLNLLKDQETFDQHFHAFIQGDVAYGSWFDHILGWLTRMDTENFLLMFYEDLLRDLRGNMQKVCQFLGKHLGPEQLDSAVQNVSFSVMNENRMSNSIIIRNQQDEAISCVPLLRKGICGDWKNHFTVSQSEAFDFIYQKNMSKMDPDLFPWSKHC